MLKLSKMLASQQHTRTKHCQDTPFFANFAENFGQRFPKRDKPRDAQHQTCWAKSFMDPTQVHAQKSRFRSTTMPTTERPSPHGGLCKYPENFKMSKHCRTHHWWKLLAKQASCHYGTPSRPVPNVPMTSCMGLSKNGAIKVRKSYNHLSDFNAKSNSASNHCAFLTSSA